MDINSFVAGFIAGEGCFGIYNHRGTLRFQVNIHLHVRDLEMLKVIKNLLGYGSIVKSYPSKPSICGYGLYVSIKNYKKILFFFDTYLGFSYKKEQYNYWKSKLIPVMEKLEKKNNIIKEKYSNMRKLRDRGLTYREIGETVGLSKQRVHVVLSQLIHN